MIPVCDRCNLWIERDNRQWPGYCSTRCRDAAEADNRARRNRRRAALRGDPTAREALYREDYL